MLWCSSGIKLIATRPKEHLVHRPVRIVVGAVAIVAHRDHAKRCVQISRRHGMNAIVATEIELPVTYDPLSGQPWTRRRDIYLAHDLAAQFIGLRSQAIAEPGET